MLKGIRHLLFTLLITIGIAWTSLYGQEPTSQPTTQAATQPAVEVLDSIPSQIDSIQNKIDTTAIKNPFADSTRLGSRPPVRRKQKEQVRITSDEVYYFYHDKPAEIIEFIDTTLNNSFLQYDPARSGKYDFATLGAIGGPLLDLNYKWKDKSGTRLGIDVFEPYIRDESEVKFYTKSKAFSNFEYSQGLEQNDHVFHGVLGRSFDNGIKFSIAHDRLIHSLTSPNLTLNGNALFPYSAAKNTSLLTGLAFQKKGSPYQAFLTYAHNEINQLYTGGLLNTNDTTITVTVLDSLIAIAQELNISTSIPSNISSETASLRYRLRTIAYHQYLTFAGKVDSTSMSNRIFNIDHKLKYIDNDYRFSDTQNNVEYYQNLSTDDRGLRVASRFKSTENYFGISTLKTKNGKVVPSTLGEIRLGLRHQFVDIDGEAYEDKFNNVFAEGSWKVNPFQSLTLDVFGQLGLLANIGDFRLNASANLDLGQWGSLEGHLKQQLYSPSLYEQQNFVTEIEVWNNNFDKSFNSELGFQYQLPKHKFEAGLSYFLLDNHIYYDDTFQPIQRSGAVNLIQVYLKKDFKWNIFHLENTVMLQSSTDQDVIRLPDWWSRHSLYAQRRIFNNIMMARLGLDLRINASYFANNFNPALGQFFVQSEREVEAFPAVDAHFGFIIEKVRFFVKMENLTSVITDNIFYQVPFYPQKELAFRFGLSWRFLDQHSNKKTSGGNSQGGNRNSSPGSSNR